MSMSQTTLDDKPIGSVGFGLMGLTWRAQPPPQKQAFEAMDAALARGANFWNGGELYGSVDRNSCHLLNEYFTKYPGKAGQVVLSIKGGLAKGEMRPDGSEANVRRSVEDCLAVLNGTKSIDIFECARVDPKTEIEVTISALAKLVREGKIGGIGLSEVKASTISRAAKIHPIAAVEVELSLWATDILRNGVAKICADLDIPIVAYSPLCRGVLAQSEQIRSNADIPEGDIKKRLPKFQDDVLQFNNKVTEEVEMLARRKGCTKAQIAIGWVSALSGRSLQLGDNGESMKLGTIIPIPGATTRERVEENMTQVELTDAEMDEIAEILKRNPIQGQRYDEHGMSVAEG